MIVIFFTLFFVTSLLSSTISYNNQTTRTIIIDTLVDDYRSIITKELVEPIYLSKISFSSDVFFENDEFFYLTNLHDSSKVTLSQLIEAIEYLIKKNKFSTITLHFSPDSVGTRIHIDLTGFWTLAGIKIHGLLVGKDTYKQQYTMEPGDPFNQQLHANFLEKVREDLRSKGFFNGAVSSTLRHDVRTKTIRVDVFIDRRAPFVVELLPITLNASPALSSEDRTIITAYIKRHCLNRLAGFTYNRKNNNKAAVTIRKYLMQQGFLDTKIDLKEYIQREEKRVRLAFNITVQVRKKCTFLGNNFFTTATLLNYVTTLGPDTWLLPAAMLQQAVSKLYVEKGFRNVTVTCKEEPTELFFIIDEGIRSRIEKITITGGTFFDQNHIIKNYFKEVLKRGYCDEVLVKKAIDVLSDAYKKNGFLDITVPSIIWNSSNEQDCYDLQIFLNEGERSHIVSVRIPGYEYLEGKGPCSVTRSDGTLVPFESIRLRDQRTWLLEQLGFQGSMTAHIRHELRRTDNNISIVWLIDTGPLSSMKFGKTVITGSSGFPFSLLQREFCYREGDPWDQMALKKTLVRIKALDIFERVHVYPYAAATLEEKKAVMVKIHKDDPFEIRFRSGIALQQLSKKICFNGLTYKFGGSFIVKNPLNAADQFRIEADVTRCQRTLEILYRRPWLFSWPLKTLFKGYNNKYQQPGCIGIKKNIYQVTQQGFLMGFTKQHTRCDVGVNIGFEYMETVVQNKWNEHGMFARNIARAINFEPQLLGKKIPYALIEPTLIINQVDNNAFPCKGLFTVLALKGMLPLGKSMDLYFVRLLFEQTFYIPIKSVIVALRCRLGHILHKHFSSIMPTERFYLGGANSIRSYETDLCPPLGVVDDHGEKRLVPQGGKSMINLNIEGRFPLYGRFGAVIFQDWGALSRTTLLALREETLLAATGFGLRYHTPLGPLRFDFGIKWHAKVPQESRFAWFLTFGHAF